MAMSDQELREMVRAAVARQMPARHAEQAGHSEPLGRAGYPDYVLRTQPSGPAPSSASSHLHASHALLPLGPGGDADGRCVIEPAVHCTHCGYCQSMGH